MAHVKSDTSNNNNILIVDKIKADDEDLKSDKAQTGSQVLAKANPHQDKHQPVQSKDAT